MVRIARKDSPITSWAALPKSGLVLCFGHRRMGKSALSWYLAETLHTKGRDVVGFDFSLHTRKLLPTWVKHVSNLEALSKLRGAVVVVDEGAFKANARRHESDENIMWGKMVAISGQKEHLVLFICQHSRQLDVNLVGDADWVLMKRPSLLHIRFARPEIRPELEQAREKFDQAKGDKRAWSFVVDYHEGKTGFLKNKLPTFWSEELSKAFADVIIGQGKETKTETPRTILKQERR